MGEVTAIEEGPEVSVGEATPTQAVEIYRLFQDWHKSCGLDFPPPDDGMALEWILRVMRLGKVFVAYLDGPKHTHIPAGILGVQLSPVPWSPEKHAFLTDAFFYVPRAHHRWGVPERLIQSAKVFAGVHDVPLVITPISGRKAEARADKFFNLDTGALVGGTFIWGLKKED